MSRALFFRSLRSAHALIAAGIVLAGISSAQAAYRNLVGYDDLQTYLGIGNVPTAATIQVMQVEAGSTYMPTYGSGDLTGKFFTNVSNTNAGGSPHANTVAGNLAGNTTSIAPGIGTNAGYRILNYQADDWLNNFLHRYSGTAPLTTTARVVNHSWVGAGSEYTLALLDYTVNRSDLIHVTGLPNNDTDGGASASLWRSSFNAITVGRTDTLHIGTSIAVAGSGLYTANRTAPTLVAPANGTSYATPMVTAAAALLLDAAQSHPAWSKASYTNETRTITNAESSEVIKAILMAGADRHVDNATGADITNYTVDTANGLDHRYGAGQLNIYNSYRILEGAEQDSLLDGNLQPITHFGWDYDNHFGGQGLANATGSYFFTADGSGSLIADLAWNLNVLDPDGGSFSLSGALYNLNLALFDQTIDPLNPVALSDSTIDNTENIWFTGLLAGHAYELRVLSTGASFNFDYGLAWRIDTIPEPASIALLALGGLTLLRRRNRRAS